ncbi:MAG: hypothetical protein EXQ82_03295 [Pseudolabrys sp.]|nr:hypothetical protein [Pseudolabrys sp.]
MTEVTGGHAFRSDRAIDIFLAIGNTGFSLAAATHGLSERGLGAEQIESGTGCNRESDLVFHGSFFFTCLRMSFSRKPMPIPDQVEDMLFGIMR